MSTTATYRLWVNEPRTLLVRLWDSGVVEVATREASWHTWGPPTICEEEKGTAAGLQEKGTKQ